MERSPESLVLEADYWKGVLAELRTLNDLILDLSSAVATSSVDLVHFAMLVRSEDDGAALRRLIAGKRETMALVGRLQEPLDAILALATGRGTIMTSEAATLSEADDD